jgi:hypothetical protein
MKSKVKVHYSSLRNTSTWQPNTQEKLKESVTEIFTVQQPVADPGFETRVFPLAMKKLQCHEQRIPENTGHPYWINVVIFCVVEANPMPMSRRYFSFRTAVVCFIYIYKWAEAAG